MIFLLGYLTFFLPAVYASNRFRALRGARRGYLWLQLLLFAGLFLLGFLLPPVALIALLVQLFLAGRTVARELHYRHRTVQYLRGNGPRPAPLRGQQEEQ